MRPQMAVVAALVLAILTVRVDGQSGERRVVLVTVLEEGGRPVPGLTAANFKATSRGRPVPVVSSREAETPRHIAVLVDISGSEKEAVGRQWAKAQALIDQLSRGHAVGLFAVNERLTKYSDFTTDRDALRQAVRAAGAVAPSGKSSLYDGVVEAAAAIPDPQPGDAVCLFSDGEDTTSRRTANEAAELLRTRNIRVFLLGDAADLPPFIRSGPAKSDWKSFTETTGGWTSWFDSAKQAPAGFIRASAELAAALASGYQIELDLPGPVDKAGKWELRVTGSDGRPLKNARVSYPQLLAPSAIR